MVAVDPRRPVAERLDERVVGRLVAPDGLDDDRVRRRERGREEDEAAQSSTAIRSSTRLKTQAPSASAITAEPAR